MFLCKYMFACACLYSLHVANRLRSLLSFEESKIKLGDQMTQFFEFHEIEHPKHLFGEGKCPLTHYVPFTL
jgi:hypothetical protein